MADILVNGNMELWAGGPTNPPDSFAYYQDGTGGSVAREGTIIHGGTYSCKVTPTSQSGNAESVVFQRIEGAPALAFRGKTYIHYGWIKSANTVANKIGLQMYDEVNGGSYGFYQNSGDWEFVFVIKTFSTALTLCDIGKCWTHGAADAVAYFDDLKTEEMLASTNLLKFYRRSRFPGSIIGI